MYNYVLCSCMLIVLYVFSVSMYLFNHILRAKPHTQLTRTPLSKTRHCRTSVCRNREGRDSRRCCGISRHFDLANTVSIRACRSKNGHFPN